MALGKGKEERKKAEGGGKGAGKNLSTRGVTDARRKGRNLDGTEEKILVEEESDRSR